MDKRRFVTGEHHLELSDTPGSLSIVLMWPANDKRH